ncbi:MAG: hypothetical protein D6778_00590 [Nitrospirae bacterium]|nr:MAG: hypothetical protein D6778_00590 [Nitrospirota bacterium]
MKEAVKGIIKKVTLEMVYEVVDERTADIKEELKDIKTEIRNLNSRIDALFNALLSLKSSLPEK